MAPVESQFPGLFIDALTTPAALKMSQGIAAEFDNTNGSRTDTF